MSNGLVKLIAVTGVIGAALLVVLQAQSALLPLKGLTGSQFTVATEVEPGSEDVSPSLTNLGDAPPASSLVAPASPMNADTGRLPTDDLLATSMPLKLEQPAAGLLPPDHIAPSASEKKSVPAPLPESVDRNAPRLSFKDEPDAEANADNSIASESELENGNGVVLALAGEAKPETKPESKTATASQPKAPPLLLPPGLGKPLPLPEPKVDSAAIEAAPAKLPAKVLQISGSDSDPEGFGFGGDPFAEDDKSPPKKKSAAAPPASKDLPVPAKGGLDDPFGDEPHAPSGPGRVALEQEEPEQTGPAVDVDAGTDPFSGSEPPAGPIAAPAESPKLELTPQEEADLFGGNSGKPAAEEPEADLEFRGVPVPEDAFSAEETQGPVTESPAPALRLPGDADSEFPVLPGGTGTGSQMPESLPLPDRMPAGDDDFPTLPRTPAPVSDEPLEEELVRPQPQDPEPAPSDFGQVPDGPVVTPRRPEVLPNLNVVPDEPRPPVDAPQAPARDTPLRLTGDREPAPEPVLPSGTLSREEASRGEQQPRLLISKVAPKQATLGQPLIYEVIVRNSGDVPAHQVVVEDQIPRGSRLTGTIPRAEMLDRRLFWKLGTVQPGEERKIAVRVIPEEEGSIGSVAKVNFVAEISAETVITAPQLALKVECPPQVRMGDPVELKFVIRNTGNGEAKNVVLVDTLPKSLQHPAGLELENAIGDLQAGETRELILQVTASDAGSVRNHAVVTADGGLKVEDATQLEVLGEQLTLVRKGQSRVYVGRAAVYSYSITNEGKQPVQRALLIEHVPAGFEFVEASDKGYYDRSAGTVSWKLDALLPGETRSVTGKYSARTIGEFASHVELTGAAGSLASVGGQVTVAGMPALTVESTGEGRVVAVGERLVSKILLTNRGTAKAENIELTINLPDELKLVSAKGPSKHRVQGRAVIFERVPNLEARNKSAYELTLEAVAEGDSRLELQIAADHLTKPVHREESVQVVTGDVSPPR